MAFSDDLDLANNGKFRVKIRIAITKTANSVAGETPASPANTALDDKRHALSQNVYSDVEIWTDRFALACAAQGTLTTASTDADVEFTVASLWNDLAGVTGAEAGA